MYTYYNPNPDGKRTGDCVIRAIARVTGGTLMENARNDRERQMIQGFMDRM